MNKEFIKDIQHKVDTHLKWRSGQQAKDVTGAAGRAGQQRPEMTSRLRCSVAGVLTYLAIQLKHPYWRRELLQQGKGEKEGRFLTT